MNCADFHELVMIGIHGRLTAGQRAEIDRHRSACAECAALYERFNDLMILQAEALKQVASVPTPDWDGSWTAIEKRSCPERSPFVSFFGRLPRWAPAAAAVLLVFALGYFIGRGIIVDDVTPGPSPAVLPATGPGLSPVFASYADGLKPVLVNFLNRGEVAEPEDLRALEREIIRDMLSQTRILGGLAAKTGDVELADLLIDLEFVLTSLANLAPGDEASAAHLERMIREKDVPLRLRELASPVTI